MERVPFQIHGVISSDSDSDPESKNYFDEEYNSLKPPPFEYEIIKHDIVKISPKIPEIRSIWEEGQKNAIKESYEQTTNVIKTKRKRKKKSGVLPNISSIPKMIDTTKEAACSNFNTHILRHPEDNTILFSEIVKNNIKPKNTMKRQTPDVLPLASSSKHTMTDTNTVNYFPKMKNSIKYKKLNNAIVDPMTEWIHSNVSGPMIQQEILQFEQSENYLHKDYSVNIKSFANSLNTYVPNDKQQLEELRGIILNNNFGIIKENTRKKKKNAKKLFGLNTSKKEEFCIKPTIIVDPAKKKKHRKRSKKIYPDNISIEDSHPTAPKANQTDFFKTNISFQEQFKKHKHNVKINQFSQKELSIIENKIDKIKNQSVWHKDLTDKMIQDEKEQLRKTENETYRKWLDTCKASEEIKSIILNNNFESIKPNKKRKKSKIEPKETKHIPQLISGNMKLEQISLNKVVESSKTNNANNDYEDNSMNIISLQNSKQKKKSELDTSFMVMEELNKINAEESIPVNIISKNLKRDNVLDENKKHLEQYILTAANKNSILKTLYKPNLDQNNTERIATSKNNAEKFSSQKLSEITTKKKKKKIKRKKHASEYTLDTINVDTDLDHIKNNMQMVNNTIVTEVEEGTGMISHELHASGKSKVITTNKTDPPVTFYPSNSFILCPDDFVHEGRKNRTSEKFYSQQELSEITTKKKKKRKKNSSKGKLNTVTVDTDLVDIKNNKQIVNEIEDMTGMVTEEVHASGKSKVITTRENDERTVYQNNNFIGNSNDFVHYKEHSSIEALQCLKCLNSDLRLKYCYYYDYIGNNFHYFMDFKERYLNTCLEKNILYGNNKNENYTASSKTSSNGCDIKINIIINQMTFAQQKNLRDDVNCFYYEFEGENFNNFIKFREIYLSGALNDLFDKRREKKSLKFSNATGIVHNNNCQVSESLNSLKELYEIEKKNGAVEKEQLKRQENEMYQKWLDTCKASKAKSVILGNDFGSIKLNKKRKETKMVVNETKYIPQLILDKMQLEESKNPCLNKVVKSSKTNDTMNAHDIISQISNTKEPLEDKYKKYLGNCTINELHTNFIVMRESNNFNAEENTVVNLISDNLKKEKELEGYRKYFEQYTLNIANKNQNETQLTTTNKNYAEKFDSQKELSKISTKKKKKKVNSKKTLSECTLNTINFKTDSVDINNKQIVNNRTITEIEYGTVMISSELQLSGKSKLEITKENDLFFQNPNDFVQVYYKTAIESLQCLKCLNGDVRLSYYYYYDYVGSNFKRFMDFKERYLNTSLDKVNKKKVNGNRKNENYFAYSIGNVIKNKLDMNKILIYNLRDEVKCFYYEFGGTNFNRFMRFREIYLSGVLNDLFEERREDDKNGYNAVVRIVPGDSEYAYCDFDTNTSHVTYDNCQVSNSLQSLNTNYLLFFKIVHLLVLFITIYVFKLFLDKIESYIIDNYVQIVLILILFILYYCHFDFY